jgi:sterol desaturase/sphingolipid hydroxylase (fatty acid hydroxylase superfamily)
MTHIPINHNPEPIRLFDSDFLEFFSHIHPAVIVIIWLPVAAFFLVREVLNRPGNFSPLYIPLGFLLGLFLWTLAEYGLHRFVFHFRPRTPRQERIIFLFHGVHHAQPQCKTRLVMPPVVSIPMAVIFYGLLTLLVGLVLGQPHLVGPLTSGLLIGYINYDLTHYATHHFPMRGKLLRYLKRYHMLHHYKTPDQRFGVSSPLWDIVFKTKPG